MSEVFDLLKPENILPINVKFINKFGLETAVYLSVIMSAKTFSVILGELEEDDKSYIILNRKYVECWTSLTETLQKELDKSLKSAKILCQASTNSEAVRIDEEVLLSYFITKAVEVSKKAPKKYKKTTKAEQKKERQMYMLESVISVIAAEDPEVRAAYEKWIRAVAVAHGIVSTDWLRYSENLINEYSKGNLKKAKEVLELAADFSYRDVHYAISKLDGRKSYKNNQTTSAKLTTDVNERSDELVGEDLV